MEGLTEEELELLDPHPDIHALFCHYNTLYFDEKLGACSVEWSSGRMTSCGGVCEWRPGGGCRIKLSEPLLKLRPARDLKMVLLHEMVHAYMMLGGIKDDDPGGHGTIFQSVIARINTSTQPDHQRPSGGYNITITHNYIAEAEHYRRHWWRCDRCDRVVKRAMNRPPQEADCRLHVRGRDCGDAACSYHMHVKHCGGTFVKIKEPEGFQDKKKKKAEDAGGSSSEAAAAAAGSSDGGASQRPDGVPLPAKRPKKAGGRLAGAGDRPITDFFPTRGSSGPGTGPAAAGEAAL
ncbi:sprT-like domain-containing Spartan [Micractinium conductrix]|uniref:SprT-like domain-containing Spartan n=1 Tax=Micractinium conductrix TaxID=554055 RepID=A0A2P6VLG3_9CHLO|nr:sprT-like domain-containing Spartan [Micractinium conductrix]|eukprot:PSC74929.1 sprT-like domain-containing Spartan [Micractinium conductrix]